MSITSRAEYEAARRRIVELGKLPEGVPGAETELTVLVELTAAWEAEHAEDDAVEGGATLDQRPSPRDD